MWNQKIQLELSLTVFFVVINFHKPSPISLTELSITINSLREAYIIILSQRPWSLTQKNGIHNCVLNPCNHQKKNHKPTTLQFSNSFHVNLSSVHLHVTINMAPGSQSSPSIMFLYMATRMPSEGFSTSSVQAFQQQICTGIEALVVSHFHRQPSR